MGSLLLLRRHYPELLSNIGFELPGAGGVDVWLTWTESPGDGVLADEGTKVHSGNHAAKVTAGASKNAYVYQTHAVVPGTSYTVTFWTAGDGTNASRYRIWDATNSASIIALSSTDVTAGTYTQVSVSFTVPATCVSVEVQLWNGSVVGAVSYFDDTSLKRK